jgi:hypothetical protein
MKSIAVAFRLRDRGHYTLWGFNPSRKRFGLKPLILIEPGLPGINAGPIYSRVWLDKPQGQGRPCHYRKNALISTLKGWYVYRKQAIH